MGRLESDLCSAGTSMVYERILAYLEGIGGSLNVIKFSLVLVNILGWLNEYADRREGENQTGFS